MHFSRSRARCLVALTFFVAISASTAASLASPEDERIRLKEVPTVGSVLRPRGESHRELVVASAQTYPMYRATARGLDLIFCVDRENRVRWVSTSDSDFVSPEGLRIGDPITRAAALAGEPVQSEIGWAWYVALPSGWNARVNIAFQTPAGPRLFVPDPDHRDPPPEAVIGEFFMRG